MQTEKLNEILVSNLTQRDNVVSAATQLLQILDEYDCFKVVMKATSPEIAEQIRLRRFELSKSIRQL